MEKLTSKPKIRRSVVFKPKTVKIGGVPVTIHPHPGKGTLSLASIQRIVKAALLESNASK